MASKAKAGLGAATLSEEKVTTCAHDWRETGRVEPHASVPVAIQVRCRHCNAVGFRRPESKIVYTWEQE